MKAKKKKITLRIGEEFEVVLIHDKKIVAKKTLAIEGAEIKIPEFYGSRVETILNIRQVQKIIYPGGWNCRHRTNFLEQCNDGKGKLKKKFIKKVSKVLKPKKKKK